MLDPYKFRQGKKTLKLFSHSKYRAINVMVGNAMWIR